MEFKSVAIPALRPGITIVGKKIVVPNQAMSLEEILRRFVRNESLPIGKDSEYYEDGEDDLEKIPHMDLVDQMEYMDKLKETQKAYKVQESKKAKAEHDRLYNEKVAEIKKEAEKAVKAEVNT